MMRKAVHVFGMVVATALIGMFALLLIGLFAQKPKPVDEEAERRARLARVKWECEVEHGGKGKEHVDACALMMGIIREGEEAEKRRIRALGPKPPL